MTSCAHSSTIKKVIPSARGCAECLKIGSTCHVKGELTGAQRLRLLEIAEKCPVSLTLRHAAVVASTLAT